MLTFDGGEPAKQAAGSRQQAAGSRQQAARERVPPPHTDRRNYTSGAKRPALEAPDTRSRAATARSWAEQNACTIEASK
jgi:hypothetical protein